MVWTISRPESKGLNKDTRWDRIRKKHTNNLNMKSSLVKKFVEMDFVGRNNTKLLNGEIELKNNLNPHLVMDLRHEMFQKKPNRSSMNVKKYKANTDKCIMHNLEVEERYILNELSKFRAQLEKKRQQYKIKPVTLDSDSDHFRLNNVGILKSLENTTRHIEDFYRAPQDAMEQFESLVSHVEMDNQKLPSEEESLLDSATKQQTENGDLHCVRFEDKVEIVKYSREASTCSNTSNGIDSVISDLAEEALNEIEMENAIEDDDGRTFQIEGSALRNNLIDPLIVTKMLPKEELQIIENDDATNSTEETEESVTNEQNAIIENLFQARSHSNGVVLRNYFLKWIHYTTIQRIERQNMSSRNDRIHKINNFLDHIRREKKNQVTTSKVTKSSNPENKIQSINISKKYQSKIKIQQDIIDLQKMKLERQERLITELKLNKLSDEAKEARQEIKAELKNALRTGDSKARAKAKCLQIMGNLRDEEDDEFTRLQGRAMLQPKFLSNMQERALVRSVKHEQARQRRLHQEAEREAAKMALEEAKRQEDEEAKRMRMEALKEKRRREKMAKVLKEREHQRAIENNKKAQQFCRHYLLRRIGMEGFKRLLQRKILNQKKSDTFRKQLLKKNTFKAWKNLYLTIVQRKNFMANELHDKIITRTVFHAWVRYLNEERSKFLVAVDWYELKLNQTIITQWLGFTKLQKMVEDVKMKQAELHYEWHLKWKVVDRWQQLPQILKLEKETNERRQRWRMKIWELLPDYTPNKDF
ncbi:uncharacterized protein LOC129951428 [Eupeodes corollae]|uniref:uncharacterized protein LOC129951428 n=1 Tax=Eupeodes corollae TaxID=290404 RepID=UPI00249315B5|nr:uncharacterized protein LOC129951428 [Eupeodes corollae]